MAQPLTADQLQAALDKVAADTLAGTAVDISQLTYGAGCAIKLAGDDGDAEMLTALVLVGSGNYEQAISLIFKLAMADARAHSADDDSEPEEEPDLITGILSSPGPAAAAAGPAAAPKSGPRPTQAAAPAAPAAPAAAASSQDDDEPEATVGRRARRRATRRAGQPNTQS